MKLPKRRGIEAVDIKAMKASKWWRYRSVGYRSCGHQSDESIEAVGVSKRWGIEAMKASKR
jgi:esterase/lipase